ncbi:hypothetical protein GOP47_0007820 [Adiantum capillus-veneris]|uniref:FAF domain-containing protein n=1 Tax=Adiantum capillus-veneris TaxID=13818 RepID=A0A9D4ZLW6_ADICA|nr:hypothetical protein GOP47_0007820 [Adiantum capillus-veneris]
MTIYPLSGASWPAKQQSSSALEEAHGYGLRALEMQMQVHPSSCQGPPRQWELRRIATSPILDAGDYWSDASLSLPHLASMLPQVEEKKRVTTPRRLVSEEARRCSDTRVSSDHELVEVKPSKAFRRSSTFPPPLDSPAHLACEGRYSSMQTVEKVCFTSIRSNGRLIVTATPIAAQPLRRFHLQRRNGRLLLQLHVERRSTEEKEEEEEERPLAAEVEEGDPIAREGNPVPEMVRATSPFAQNGKERARKASPQSYEDLVEEDDAERVNGKVSLYTKVLKTLECDALNDSTEGFSPIQQLHVKYGRRSSAGVASFLHKSLTRVRPLHMLTIWQS